LRVGSAEFLVLLPDRDRSHDRVDGIRGPLGPPPELRGDRPCRRRTRLPNPSPRMGATVTLISSMFRAAARHGRQLASSS